MRNLRCVSCGHIFFESGELRDPNFATYPLLRREVDRTAAQVVWETPATCIKVECIEKLLADPSWERRDFAADRRELEERMAASAKQAVVLQPLWDARAAASRAAWEAHWAAEKELKAKAEVADKKIDVTFVERFFETREACTYSEERAKLEATEDEAALRAAGLVEES